MRRKGCEIKRQKIMMIWSFNRNRHPDDRSVIYKVRVYYNGGQYQWDVQY